MSRRAVIYARMSPDRQNHDSPHDQVAHCREFARAEGLEVLDDFVVLDSGISGASRHNRPRLLSLFDRMHGPDVLLCWEFSRLARDSEDLGWIRNQLRLHRKTAREASTGLDISNVGSKVMGILSEEYLVKLRADTRRGLRGRVERKMFAGGTPYGYRTEPISSGLMDPHGIDIPAGYRLVVDPEQAHVVRRIFLEYVSGEGFRAIAAKLNAEGILSPRGKGWALSAVRSLLMNPIYKGEYVWGKSE